MNKKELRTKIKKLLKSISAKEREQKSLKATQILCDNELFSRDDVKIIMFFMSLPTEIDTLYAIKKALDIGIEICVPVVVKDKNEIIPVMIRSLNDSFEKDQMGILTPVKRDIVDISEIDVVITPGLGFDMEGNRLGRGGGYYDRFFSKNGFNAEKWGFCFGEQVAEDLPIEDNDRKVDFLVTDKGFYSFK